MVDGKCKEGEKSFRNLKGESTGVTPVRRYSRERAPLSNCFGMGWGSYVVEELSGWPFGECLGQKETE